MAWTFEKHERQNAANAAAKRTGGRLTYDYRVLRDGEHVAWFLRDSAGYWLTDLHFEAIRRDRTPLDRATVPAVRVKSQAAFLPTIERQAHKIPTRGELAARKAEREARKQKATAELEQDKLLRPELYR